MNQRLTVRTKEDIVSVYIWFYKVDLKHRCIFVLGIAFRCTFVHVIAFRCIFVQDIDLCCIFVHDIALCWPISVWS